MAQDMGEHVTTSMRHWNYRMTRETGDDPLRYHYAIREVYYNDDGTVSAWTAEPAVFSSSTLEDVAWALRKAQEALDKDVVDLDEINARWEAQK